MTGSWLEVEGFARRFSSSYLVLPVADALGIIVAASSGSAVAQEEYYYSC